MRNETQERSGDHRRVRSVNIERQQSSGGTAARQQSSSGTAARQQSSGGTAARQRLAGGTAARWLLLLAGVVCMLIKAEWNEIGVFGMGGMGMLPVYWLLMSIVTLGARDALRRAMDQNAIVNIDDPLKMNARELARLQGLTRAALWLAVILSMLFVGAATAALVLFGAPASLDPFFYEFQISTVMFVWFLGVAALWVLLDIAMEYLHRVGDGRFATVLELVVAAAFGMIAIVPILGSGGIALIGLSAVFLVGLVAALARMRRVKPWMPEGGRKELLRETPRALIVTLLYLLFVLLNAAEAHRFSWLGYPGNSVMGFYHLVVVAAALGLLMLEMAKPARRLDRLQTAPLAAGISAFLLLIGLILLGSYYGLVHVEDPYGVMFRVQFFFAAGFVLMVMFAKQNFRMVLAEIVLLAGGAFALMGGSAVECMMLGLGFSGAAALLCLPEWLIALKRLGKWLRTI